MPKRFHSSFILVAVFALGIAGGIAGMVWAWPGMRAHFFPRHHPTFVQFLKPVGLSAAQIPQVQAISKETRERSHQLHLQFVPDYAKICNEFTQVRRQEDDAQAPIRQEELDKLHAIMTPDQWQKFQNVRAQQRVQQQRNQPQRGPDDMCHHMYPPSGGPTGPGAHPPAPPPGH